MTQLLHLPITDGNKFFVVSEGIDATYAECLTIAWLQVIRKKNPKQPIIILLFSYPKSCLDKHLKTSNLTDIVVKDYFSINCQTKSTDVLEEITRIANQHASSVLVINCLSTLALQIGPARALRFIEKLQQNHKSQIFCLHRRDFCKNIPRIETLSNIYVTLTKFKKTAFESDTHYQVAITHRKSGGSVTHSNELVCQNFENYSLRSEKIKDHLTVNLQQNKTPEPKPQASFRIEMNEQEMRQRDSVPLPYVLSSDPNSKKSKIIYVPDDADDLDEEDPDDDLDI